MSLQIKKFDSLQDYQTIWCAMQQFTDTRTPSTFDQIWFLQHYPIITLGQAGKEQHILNPHNIPVIRCDRGGQVTYHGPGQLMIYTLLDLKRLQLSARDYVHSLESIIVNYLSSLDIQANVKKGAPGVYIDDAKICAIGLRIRRGYSYHGLAFNLDMDLTPFRYINPCGFTELAVTQLSSYRQIEIGTVIDGLSTFFEQQFS